MRVAISGASGLIGSALVAELVDAGHDLVRLVRRDVDDAVDAVRWDPVAQTIDRDGLNGIDAVVHLAAENIAARRWSARQKARIRDSRVQGTRLICETVAQLSLRPHTVVSFSGIGYYGDRGDVELDESAGPGTGFLPEVCQAWESATEPAREAGIRVVLLRCGVVLSRHGGALAQMLPFFRLGLGGVVGTGRQYWSWIAMDDVVRIILRAIEDPNLVGPVNCVAPHPVTNRQFTRALGRVLHRPTLLPLPGPLARLLLGEMARELLMASARLAPARLRNAGHSFLFSELEPALHHVLD